MATQVMLCDCTSVQQFEVKSGGARARSAVRPVALVPWFNQSNGAHFQDSHYGPNMRLHNLGVQGGKSKTATCTVCNRRKTIN